jgi:hypothetical protein
MPMTFYSPEQTRRWSTRELAGLIDKAVSISFRPDGSSPNLGRVADAGIGRFGDAWVEFDDGGSVVWSRDEVSAIVIVED